MTQSGKLTILRLFIAALSAGLVAVISGSTFADDGDTALQVALELFQTNPEIVRPSRSEIPGMILYLIKSVIEVYSESPLLIIISVIAIVAFIIWISSPKD